MALPLRRALRRWRRLDPAWEAALTSWVVARVAVALGFLVAHGVVDGLRGGEATLQLEQGLVAWDGAFYRDLATAGYGGVREEALRFFPLFPVLGRALDVVLPGGAAVPLVLVANVAALVAGVLLHRLVTAVGRPPQEAATATWLLAVLPASSVLVLAYTESLFLALSIGALLALHRRRWWLVAGLGVAAGLCRPSGALLALPVAIEAVRVVRTAPWRERVAMVAATAGAPLGTASFLVWAEVRLGDGLAPLRLQSSGDLRGSWVDPVTRVVDAIGDAGTGGLLGEALHLPWIALAVVLVAVAARRLPVAWTAYAVAVVLLALSAESLGSFERYALTAFPLLVAGASLLRAAWLERVVVTASCGALTAFTALVLLGVFVP